MATQSLPNQSVTVPISEEEFQELEKITSALDSVCFLALRAYEGHDDQAALSIHTLLKPYESRLWALREKLESRFCAEKEKGGEA